MIADQVERNVRSSGMGEAIPISIDAEDMGFVSGLLTDKLYSDKILAIIREYLANACDANVEANSTRKIFITVPNTFEPYFKVRDFGSGLSREDIEKIYVKLGKSTKRMSNKSLGIFGIGCKSGFCYSDSFNVSSWQNGVCSTYTAQKDRAGNLGIIPVASFASDEPDGIEVSFVIDEHDISQLNKKLANFCKYLEDVPEFSDPAFVVPKIDYVCNFADFFIEKAGEYGSSRVCKVLMGHIIYPIDLSSLMPQFRNISNVVIRCEIGEINVAPDREKLEYTEKTVDALNNKFATILETIKTDVQKNIDACTFPWEVTAIVQNLNSSFHSSLSLKINDFTFKGRKIENLKTYATFYTKNYKGKFECSNAIPNIHHATETTVIVLAPNDSRIIPSRLSNGIKDKFGLDVSRFILCDDKDVYAALFCDCWKPEQVVVDFKSLWAKPVKGVGKASAATIAYFKDFRYHRRQRSRKHRVIDIVDNKVYISMTGRSPVDSDGNTYTAAARQLGIPYYMVNRTKIGQLDATWKTLKEVVEARVADEIKKFDLQAFLIKTRFSEIADASDMENFVNDHCKTLSNYDAQAIGLFKKFHNISKTADSGIMESVSAIAALIGQKIDTTETDAFKQEFEIVKAFFKKYAFMVKMYDYSAWRMGECKEYVKDYIEMLNNRLDKKAVLK